MRLPRHPRVWLAGLLAWLGLLWWLSSRTGLPGPDLFPHFDKVAHFTYFAGGAFLFGGWQARKLGVSRISGRLILLTIVFISVVGIIDEWHQLHTPGRSGGDVWDWLADTLGAICGAFVLKSVHPQPRRDSRSPAE